MNADRILIVGGGASGVLLAAQLLRGGPESLVVTIVEKRPIVGAGIAYSTDEPDHLLNTRASSMSAFPDDPEHFWRWLQESGQKAQIGCADPFCFVPRRVYRAYLGDLLLPWRTDTNDGRLRLIEGDCVDVREMRSGVAVELADGRTELAGSVVVATGHAEPASASGVAGAWCTLDELAVAPDARIVILGTGLSMIDNVALLRRAGHRGPITALSRRGLLPHRHAASIPLKLDPADIPFGTSLSYLLRWLRQTARWREQQGGDWRDLVDALRPHTQSLWQSMSLETRARFLRHARTLWEVHRHRMAPQAARGLHDAMREGQVAIVAGRTLETRTEGDATVMVIRERGTRNVRELVADRIIDCTGILRDPTTGSGRLAARLIETGHARLDPLAIGIEVDGHGSIVNAKGMRSQRLFAVGPVTRARFWEITAIPDIRVQCAALAKVLVAQRWSDARREKA